MPLKYWNVLSFSYNSPSSVYTDRNLCRCPLRVSHGKARCKIFIVLDNKSKIFAESLIHGISADNLHCPEFVRECDFPASNVFKIIIFIWLIRSSKSRKSMASSKLLAASFFKNHWSERFKFPVISGYFAWKSNFDIIRPPYANPSLP